MGEHSKPDRFGKLRAVVAWALSHKRVILSFVVGAVSAITAVKPDFPGRVVVDVAHAILGV
ncbi:hypothetical protein SEA_EURATIS_20 [Streptomyces phage Euratis]|uniref:Uncharacterized protein n=1 Tax=Streptomyces phage Euratis TaxID=2510569 RepID=A0A411B0Y8_9CAUD|nr:hypothetical protein SEA_EURATIS_20 [Streptomyces phage Euratis]